MEKIDVKHTLVPNLLFLGQVFHFRSEKTRKRALSIRPRAQKNRHPEVSIFVSLQGGDFFVRFRVPREKGGVADAELEHRHIVETAAYEDHEEMRDEEEKNPPGAGI